MFQEKDSCFKVGNFVNPSCNYRQIIFEEVTYGGRISNQLERPLGRQKKRMDKRGRVRIGISNAFVPGNKKSFPEAFHSKSRLHYYSSIFNTAEINRCFYKTPKRSTVEKWSNDVSDGFQITLKVSKEITHIKNLESDFSCIGPFINAADGAGKKKGCLLIQFPGKVNLDHFEKVEQILRELQQHDLTEQWRKAIEFRDASWYIGETTELMNEYKATVVLHDFAKGKISNVMSNADFVYLRFHGPNGDYRDSYPDHFLRSKALDINGWLNEGKDVYAYFNNTIGNAFENARTLKLLLQ